MKVLGLESDNDQCEGVGIWVANGVNNKNNVVNIAIRDDGDGLYVHVGQGEGNDNNTVRVGGLANSFATSKTANVTDHSTKEEIPDY